MTLKKLKTQGENLRNILAVDLHNIVVYYLRWWWFDDSVDPCLLVALILAKAHCATINLPNNTYLPLKR